MINVIMKYYVLLNILKFSIFKIKFKGGLRVRGPVKISLDPSSEVSIGYNFSLFSVYGFNPLSKNLVSCIRCDKNSSLVIGDNVGMTSISIWATNSIVIGNNVKIGANVYIFDSDFHSLNYLNRRNLNMDSINAKSKPVKIGDDVFIGMNSVICKGVKIGDRSIIGAGSVVFCDVPSDQIWSGNPARFLKSI